MNQTLSGLTLLYVMNSPLYSSTNLKHQQTNHFNSIKINFAGSNFYSSFGKANAYLTNIHLGNFLKSPIVLSSINNAFIYDSFVVKSGNFIAGFCKFYKIQDHSIVIQQDISVASFNNNLFFKCRADDSAILYSSGWYNYYFILKDSCFIESYSTGISDDNACLMKFFISQNNNKQFEFYQNTLVNCNSPDTNVDHGPIIKSRSNVFYIANVNITSNNKQDLSTVFYTQYQNERNSYYENIKLIGQRGNSFFQTMDIEYNQNPYVRIRYCDIINSSISDEVNSACFIISNINAEFDHSRMEIIYSNFINIKTITGNDPTFIYSLNNENAYYPFITGCLTNVASLVYTGVQYSTNVEANNSCAANDEMCYFIDPFTEAPTEEITETPTEEITETPTEEITETPTEEITETPTEEITETPTEEITETPTEEITETPTEEITETPTEEITETPTEEITETPTEEITETPTEEITETPTEEITETPTEEITETPTEEITETPTEEITETPTEEITETPTEEITETPTEEITETPTEEITETPTEEITETPTEEITETPTEEITETPTEEITETPTEEITETPTEEITETPTEEITETPTEEITETPTEEITETPTEEITETPTEEITETPTEEITETPTEEITETPTEEITETPTEEITETPTEEITETPTEEIIETPTEEITETPTEEITETPTEEITETPTEEITETPTEEITETPTEEITETPTEEITETPTEEITETPTEEIIETPTEEIVYTSDTILETSSDRIEHPSITEKESIITDISQIVPTLSNEITSLEFNFETSNKVDLSIEKSIKITSDKIIENTISNFESNSENDDDGNGGDSSNADNQKKNTLSVGVIVGIVIGILALIALVLIGLFCWKRSHKSDNPSAGHEMASEEVDERTMSVSSITSFGTMESTIITQNNSLWTNAQSDDDDPFRADSDEDIMSHII